MSFVLYEKRICPLCYTRNVYFKDSGTLFSSIV